MMGEKLIDRHNKLRISSDSPTTPKGKRWREVAENLSPAVTIFSTPTNSKNTSWEESPTQDCDDDSLSQVSSRISWKWQSPKQPFNSATKKRVPEKKSRFIASAKPSPIKNVRKKEDIIVVPNAIKPDLTGFFKFQEAVKSMSNEPPETRKDEKKDESETETLKPKSSRSSLVKSNSFNSASIPRTPTNNNLNNSRIRTNLNKSFDNISENDDIHSSSSAKRPKTLDDSFKKYKSFGDAFFDDDDDILNEELLKCSQMVEENDWKKNFANSKEKKPSEHFFFDDEDDDDDDIFSAIDLDHMLKNATPKRQKLLNGASGSSSKSPLTRCRSMPMSSSNTAEGHPDPNSKKNGLFAKIPQFATNCTKSKIMEKLYPDIKYKESLS